MYEKEVLKDVVLALLDKLVALVKESEEFYDNLYTCFRIEAESPLTETTGKAIDLVSTTIETLIDCHVGTDGGDWINWWLWETEMGKKNTEVTANGKKYNLTNTEKLYDFMVMESEEGRQDEEHKPQSR